MAFTEFYVQTTGSNLNAGSTNTDAAGFTYASGSWVASTGVFTVASGDPVADGVAVGDFASVYADGSTVTGFVGRVTARTTTTITVSLTDKSGTAPTDGTGTRTLRIGGAWAGPNGAVGFPFGFVQSTMINAAGDTPRITFIGTFNVTAAMTHANAGPIRWEGATAVAGDGGLAVIDGGLVGAGYNILTITGGANDVVNLDFNHNGATGTASGVHFQGGECVISGCIARNMRGWGYISNTVATTYVGCRAENCNIGNGSGMGGFSLAAAGSIAIRCVAISNLGTNSNGFSLVSGAHLSHCIAAFNGAAGFLISGITNASLQCCDAYSNVSDGIRLSNTTQGAFYIESCNLVKNGGWGINGSGIGARNGLIRNCGFGSGTQANTSGTVTGLKSMGETGRITYSADTTPWVDPVNRDFRIESNEAKGAGYGAFNLGETVAYPDIGAGQGEATAAAIFNPLAQNIITAIAA